MTAIILDWRDPRHHAPKAAPCRHCKGSTPLRDDTGRPSHKTCAEEVAVRELHHYERQRRRAH